jgi:hypothetical protein
MERKYPGRKRNLLTMATEESKVKTKVKQVLKRYPCWTDWPVPSGYGKSTLDCIGCIGGYFFSIETKKPGGTLTALQKVTLAAMHRAGGTVFVIDTTDEKAPCFVALKAFLAAYAPHPE